MAADNEDATTESGLLVSTTALLPGTRLTFELREEERRELVEEALYRDGHLVVARTETGEFDGTLPEVATLAEILDAARPAPDRLMVVLVGERRVRPVRAAEVESGHTVHWREVELEGAPDRAAAIRAGDVLGLLQRLQERGLETAGAIREKLGDAAPSKVADVVGSVAFDDVEMHQELLEELDALERLERVERQLDRLLDE